MTDRLRVGDAKRDVAIGEVTALLGVVEEAAFRGELKALAAGIEAGELGPGAQATLEQVLELGLQAGRIRAVLRAGRGAAGLALYRRLPAGAALVESARELSAALRALQGLELGSIELRAVGPGAFTLSLPAGELQLSLRLDRQGARLSSVRV